MKPIAALSTILLAVCCSAAELTPNLLRLISADARMVSGVDRNRQSNSALSRFFKSDHVGEPAAGPRDTVVWIMNGSASSNRVAALIAILHAIPSQEPDSKDAGDRADGFTSLDARVMISSDPEAIREAQRRWTIDQPLSPAAEKVRRLSQSYDSWVFCGETVCDTLRDAR